MAVWSEVDSNDAIRIDRFDADYYRPEFLALDKLIENSRYEWKYLEQISTAPITKGETPLWRGDDYEKEGVLFLRSENLEPCGIKDTNQVYIAEDVDERMKRSRIESGDVLIAIVGATTGMVGLVPEDSKLLRANINQAVARIRNLKLNKFLSIYLLSNIAQLQIERFSGGGAARDNLDLHEVRRIQCPILDDSNFTEIENYVTEIQRKRIESKTLYQKAEALLLHELGLDALDLSDEITYERNFDEVAQAGRFDAEYFHPEKKEVLDSLAKMNGQTVGEHFLVINNLINPQSNENQQKKDVKVQNYDLDESLQFFLDDIEQMNLVDLGSAKKAFQKGDVVVSRLRSYLKEIAIVKSSNYCVGSSEYIVLRSNNSIVSPELLTVYLRSSAVQKILKWSQDGSNHPRFKETELLAIKIPDKLISVQNEIIKLLKDSIDSIIQAKQLLEDAKRRVEDMILGA